MAMARSGRSMLMSKFTSGACHDNLCVEKGGALSLSTMFQGHRGDDRGPARENPHRRGRQHGQISRSYPTAPWSIPVSVVHSSGDELLAAIDIVRPACECCVAHDVNG